MLKPLKIINRSLSIRISLMVVFAIALLLSTALFVMFRHSRRAVKEEALNKAEQTLESTVQQIDNVLLSIEQTTGNIYHDMLTHLDEPDRMSFYARKLIEANPYVKGCAIVFEPYHFKDRGELFMVYPHHKGASGLQMINSPIVETNSFGHTPYTEQIWYTTPMEIKRPCWVGPLKENEAEDEAIVTFCLPFFNSEGKTIGVLSVDLSLSLISEITLAVKPSTNSFAVLLGNDGSYIVHPDSNKLIHETIYSLVEQNGDTSLRSVADSMTGGKTGYQKLWIDGIKNYVFYKPFKRSFVPGRSMDDMGWSACIIYPEDDIFGEYNQLLTIVLSIAIFGVLLLFMLCHMFTHHQLQPLRLLTKSAKRIAEGHYDETIPNSRHHDEVGTLQCHFKRMQKALATHVYKLEQLTDSLNEQGDVLARANMQAKEADRMKIAFLHNMTNQMVSSIKIIVTRVNKLCEHHQDLSSQETFHVVDDIQVKGQAITELLNDMLVVSQEKKEKEKEQK